MTDDAITLPFALPSQLSGCHVMIAQQYAQIERLRAQALKWETRAHGAGAALGRVLAVLDAPFDMDVALATRIREAIR